MFHILGFLFIIIVVILVIGLSIIGTVLRTVFGLGKRRSSSGTYQNGGGSYQSGGGYSFSGDQQQNNSSQSNGETTSYKFGLPVDKQTLRHIPLICHS